MAAVEELCRTGSTDAPVYDIATNSRTGHRVLDLGRSAYFVAEGIFAQEIVAECRRRRLLADAVCVTQHPAVTFVRRLARDLREHRKPPFVLVRRGLHLLLAQRAWSPGRAARLPRALPERRTARSALTGLPAGLPRSRTCECDDGPRERSSDPSATFACSAARGPLARPRRRTRLSAARRTPA